MEKKTTLLSVFLPVKHQGGIYMHQENGGKGDKPWPKALARPRQYSRENMAKVVFSRLY